jgi:hypothetical protein
VPCRRSRAKETGSTTLGGEGTGVHRASADEATYNSRENEAIIGTTCSLATGYCHPEKSHEGDIETPASAG